MMSGARICGLILRCLILGTLLFVAILGVVEFSSAMRLFRYQAF